MPPKGYEDPLLRFDLDSDALTKLADIIITKHKAVEDRLAALPAAEWTREDLLTLSEAEMDFATNSSNCTFPMYSSTDKDKRDVAATLENKLDDYGVESSMRTDMYNAVNSFKERVDKGEIVLGSEELRFLEKMIRNYRRDGLALEGEKRERMTVIKKELSALSTEFSKNLNEDKTKEAFSLNQLQGMPQDWIDSLEKAEDGKVFVTLKYPDIVPISRKCKVAETRKRMDFLKGSMAQNVNVKLFEDTLALRKELAELLGYDTYSDYVLEVRMAKKKEIVLEFLIDLRDKLIPYANKELSTLLKYKEAECKEMGTEFDGKINGWDMMYYHTKILDEEYKLDDEKIKNYFPLERVTDGMFEIYQTLLGLKFEKVTDAKVWHEDVLLYAVYDKESEKFLGQFFLDMFPREGKYGHAAVFGLQAAGDRVDGLRQLPCCAMMCNFTKPTADKPSLLKHDEVNTYFHEFGHVMHNICTEAQLYAFSCTKVERDFVEAPSQMLENWTYESVPLKMMSGLYSDLDQKLPDDMLDSIIATKNVNTGLLNLRQAFFATFDMISHTSNEKIDSAELWSKLRKEVSLIPQQPGCNPVAGFGHIMGGYQSGYYGYLWSEVYSADLFTLFKGDVMSPEIGMRYRKNICAPGGSIDGLDMVKNFLGREPTQDAFLIHIGVKDESKL